MQWYSGAPGVLATVSLSSLDQCGGLLVYLGSLTTRLAAPPITVAQSGKNDIFFGNATAAPGNHSHYVSLHDFQNWCIWFVFSSTYLGNYIDIHQCMVYLDWLHTALERTIWSVPEDGSQVNLDWTESPRWNQLQHPITGHDWRSWVMHLEAQMVPVWKCN